MAKSVTKKNKKATDQEDNDSSNDMGQTKKIVKSHKYAKYRQEILTKLNDILGISEKINAFSLYELENNQDKIDQIMALKDDIKCFFDGRNNAVFRHENPVKPYLSLARIVFKGFGYHMFHSTKKDIIDGKATKVSYYIISKINS